MYLSLPNLLTWLRIVLIPLLIFVIYFPTGISQFHINLGATVIFVLAAITDWFDGWLARRWNQTSSFGAFLDPVADKLMVCTTLVALIDLDRVGPIIGAIIIGREITISALREWMLKVGAGKSLSVNALGKTKTVFQMVAIPFLLYDNFLFNDLFHTRVFGEWLILIAAVLTVISMIGYLNVAWSELREKH
jgi:CDP-diacylglycerol--glycerol-3-phosphate 3-phosphatidyltransferase